MNLSDLIDKLLTIEGKTLRGRRQKAEVPVYVCDMRSGVSDVCTGVTLDTDSSEWDGDLAYDEVTQFVGISIG